MRAQVRLWLFTTLALGFSLLPAQRATAALVDAVEFYHAGLDHYFVTASVDEINKLDTGFFAGWQRTQLTFKVLDAGSASLASPVCRFYGLPEAGLDSHFYSASPKECADVAAKFPGVWKQESSNVFGLFLPDQASGACPANTRPIYRTWNNRTDSNHRYTTDADVQRQMMALGYVAEGYGPAGMLVAMCSPLSEAGAGAPVCTITTQNNAPIPGTMLTLNAICTLSPTGYVWSGCTGAGATCTATSSAAGPVTYSVVASNSIASGAPASITVNWVDNAAPTLEPPVCTLSASNPFPEIDSYVILTASCSNDPTNIIWSNCTGIRATCTVMATSPGPITYSVSGSNHAGTGPSAFATVNWQPRSTAADFCGQYPSSVRTDLGWANTTSSTLAYTDPPFFEWNGVWVIKLSVPSNATGSGFGRLTVAENGGPPTDRQITLSNSACDFRGVDPSGANGPFASNASTTASLFYTLSSPISGYPNLIPGRTYYLNVRNWSTSSNSVSCAANTRCNAIVDIAIPR